MGDIITGFHHGQYLIVVPTTIIFHPYAVNDRRQEATETGRQVRRICNILLELGEGEDVFDDDRVKEVRKCDMAAPRCDETNAEARVTGRSRCQVEYTLHQLHRKAITRRWRSRNS